jgi:CheY-like chemotaxis protein
MRKSNDVPSAPAFRILLIDDNRNGLLARKSVLVEQGYSVTASNSPEEALEHFAESCFDLVITDYRMPRVNGLQVLARVREMNPKTPVILVSGMVDVLGLTEKNTGADAVVAKTSTEIQHMVRAVNRLLSNRATKKPPRKQAARKNAHAKTA